VLLQLTKKNTALPTDILPEESQWIDLENNKTS